MSARFTAHALEALARRGISEEMVLLVLDAPEAAEVRGDCLLLQRALSFPPDGRRYLLRVVVAGEWEDRVIVTAYRTSKLNKYGAAR